jgi:hypothetical protein
MLLTATPPGITTHEQNILWSLSELRKQLYSQSTSTAHPHQVIEAQGYYPSDVVAIQEIRSVDGGSRHVLRVLMPVSPDYYGSASPVWTFAGEIA